MHACLSFTIPASKFSLLFLILENILPLAMRRKGTTLYLLSLMESQGTSSDLTMATWMVPSRTLNIKGDEGTLRITYSIDPGRGSSSNVDCFYPVLSNSYENSSVHLVRKESVHSRGLNFMDSSSGFHNLIVYVFFPSV